jgi:hypothetical protein
MRTGLFLVQDLAVRVAVEVDLYPLISQYFSLHCNQGGRLGKKTLDLEISIEKNPPSVPPDSVLSMRKPSMISYMRGNEIYLTSADGSVIQLNPEIRKSRAVFSEEILNDTEKLFILLGGLLAEVLRYNGFHFLHSAAVKNNGISLLISGDGGSGKTTASLSLVNEGFKYVSDDSILFKEESAEIIVYPLYRAFNLDRDLSNRFPNLIKERIRRIPEGVKLSVDISEIYPDSFIPFMRPNAVIFPKITHLQNSEVHPLSQVQVYDKLLRQTVLAVDREIAKSQLLSLETLVKQVVGYELLSGKDIYENSSRYTDLIAEIEGHLI